MTFSGQFVENKGGDGLDVVLISLGNFKGSLLKLFPLAKGHQADQFLSHEGQEGGVVDDTLIEGLKCIFVLLLVVLLGGPGHEEGGLGQIFILLLPESVDELVSFAGESFLLFAKEVAPGSCNPDIAGVAFLFDEVIGLPALLDEGEEVDGLGDSPLGCVSALLSFAGAEVIDLFLGGGKGTLSMLRAWFW